LPTALAIRKLSARRRLAVLRKAEVVVQGRERLYQFPPQHLIAPGERVVDFGHCLLRPDAS
jgi:hypothetical protein